jgi:hypothetical protein
MIPQTTAPPGASPRRLITALSLAAVTAGLFASIASTDEDEPTRVENGAAGDEDSGNSNGNGNGEGADGPEEFGVGDVVELGAWYVQVHGVTDPYEESNEFLQPGEGNRYVAVDVEVTNNGDAAETVSSLLCFEIQDEQSIAYNQAIGTGTEATPDGEVAAGGGTRRGTILYEVPADAGGLVLNFSCDLFSSGTATIRL